jgi:hypothetical protein
MLEFNPFESDAQALPEERNLYHSLSKGPKPKLAQMVDIQLQDQLYGTEEKQKALVDFLVNGDDDESLTAPESIVQVELQAVTRIKLLFFDWFQSFYT